MTKITSAQVHTTAALSGLLVTEAEAESYAKEFSEIISYIEQLDSVDVDGLEPTYQVSGLQNVMRQDEVIEYGVDADQLLKNAPETKDNMLKVRRVL